MRIMMINSFDSVPRGAKMPTEEALSVFLIFLDPTKSLRPQRSPPTQGIRACQVAAHIGRTDCRGLLPTERHLIKISYSSASVSKARSDGVGREPAVVLHSTEAFFCNRE